MAARIAEGAKDERLGGFLMPAGFGMLSENLMLEKYKNADSFRLCTISSYVLAPAYGPLEGDVNRDQVVDGYDLQQIVEAWLE